MMDLWEIAYPLTRPEKIIAGVGLAFALVGVFALVAICFGVLFLGLGVIVFA